MSLTNILRGETMRGLSWRNILYSVLGVILPLIFNEIVVADPSFPLEQDIFVKVILYLLAFLVGGWNIAKAAIKHDFYLRNK